MDWISFKYLVGHLSVSKDALHIYVALIIQITTALMVRRSLSSFLPWTAVLFIELINEAFDLLFEKEPYIHRWQIEGSIHDLVNTMAIPTLLMLLVRYMPRLFASPAPATQGLEPAPEPE